jgi:hypothetical protein
MVILNEIYETLEEENSETHTHFCIDELVSSVKQELDRLYGLWNKHNLSCIKLKETLSNNGVHLFEIAETLETFNNITEEKFGVLQ